MDQRKRENLIAFTIWGGLARWEKFSQIIVVEGFHQMRKLNISFVAGLESSFIMHCVCVCMCECDSSHTQDRAHSQESGKAWNTKSVFKHRLKRLPSHSYSHRWYWRHWATPYKWKKMSRESLSNKIMWFGRFVLGSNWIVKQLFHLVPNMHSLCIQSVPVTTVATWPFRCVEWSQCIRIRPETITEHTHTHAQTLTHPRSEQHLRHSLLYLYA